MAERMAIAHYQQLADEPEVLTIEVRDRQTALWQGLDDFQAKPSHLVFLENPKTMWA